MELRDCYFSTLHERMKSDPSMFVMVGDFSAHWLERIATDFPSQYLNAGIAEQNMISLAAGMAIQGRRIYVVGQNNFITLRAMEQISVDLCQMNLPVTLVGCSSGYSWNHDGPTHHGITDLGMMMQLPCEIYNCSDENVTRMVANIQAEKPTYVRLGKGEWPNYGPIFDFSYGFRFIEQGGKKVFATGHMVHECVKSGCSVVDIFNVHPLNEAALHRVAGNYPITVFEDSLYGPLQKALSQIGINTWSNSPQSYTFEYGSREFVQRKAGL